MFLNYDEQAVIKMYSFNSKEELKEKLRSGLELIKDEEMKNIVNNVIEKIDMFSLEDLKNIDNIYE